MCTEGLRIGAVILAGGSVPPTLAQLCSQRALLRLNGRYLLEYLLETLVSMDMVVGTSIAVPEDVFGYLADLDGVKVPSSDRLVENMQRGVNALAHLHPTHYLFITGDIPLVTKDGLTTYINDSIQSGADLTYPIIPQEASEKRFPNAKRTYVKIKEGTFTGGNAILTKAGLLDDKSDLIQKLYAARKKPLQLAQILGLATVLRLISGTLALPYLEGIASRVLGAPARAIITHHAEIGFDVDKASDLAAVERALLNGGAGFVQ